MTVLYVFVLYLGICLGQELLYDQGIVRPCPDLTEECVRSFFMYHGNCTPQYGPFQDAYIINRLPIPIPHASLTVTWLNATITGMANWKPVELYINERTHNLYFKMVFDQLTTYSPYIKIRYYKLGMEPVDYSDYAGSKYNNMSLIMVVPFDSVTGIKWSEKDVYTDVWDPNNANIYGAGLWDSDAEAKNDFDRMVANYQLSIKEAGLVVSPYYQEVFFNNYICSQ